MFNLKRRDYCILFVVKKRKRYIVLVREFLSKRKKELVREFIGFFYLKILIRIR